MYNKLFNKKQKYQSPYLPIIAPLLISSSHVDDLLKTYILICGTHGNYDTHFVQAFALDI